MRRHYSPWNCFHTV